MVAPITGPLVAEQSLPIAIGRFDRVERYKQKRPHNLPLPYLKVLLVTKERWVHPMYEDGSVPQYTYPGNWNPRTRYAMTPDFYSGLDVFTNKLLVQTTNDAYAKFLSKLGSEASLGVTLAERKQTMAMLATRASQLLDFCRLLRRGDIPGAARTLGWTATRTGSKTKSALWHLSKRGVPKKESVRIRKGGKSFANNYLEFHFGWSPLIGDIYSATEVLCEPIKPTRVIGTARRNDEFFYDDDVYYGLVRAQTKHKVKCLVRVQADVAVTNPNLRLLSQMGLINPAVVAWELVPFSFVVDWFVNVSDFLGQFTALAGLDVINPQRSYKWIDEASMREFNTRFFNAFGQNHQPGDRIRCESYAFSTRRTLGLPAVKLTTRSPWDLSPRRALAAVSLLIQKGIGHKPKRHLQIS